MTRTRTRRAALPLLAAALMTTPVTAQAPRPEAIIKWRQSAYQVIGWNAGRIRSALAGRYDAAEVRSAATVLAAVAGAGLPDLFPANTAGGKGWRTTTAGAAVFSDPTRFRAASAELAREAGELARVAAAGDRAAVETQFARVARTCKSCHDQFRETD